VNVAKATGTFGSPAAVSTTYTPTLKINDVSLPANYAWVAPTTALTAGNNQAFAAIYTDPSGNYTAATGNITVNVAKATPTATFPTSATITYGQTLANAVFTGESGAGTFKFTESTTTLPVAQSGTAHQVTFTPTDADNYNTLTQNVAVTVNKATNLTATTPGKQMISSGNTAPNTFDLSTIALSKSDHGDRSYSCGTFTDQSGDSKILATAPTLSGTTLTYTGNGKTSGTATQIITITSQNYADVTVTITFEATSKTDVTITGLTAQDGVYDGTPKRGVSGAAVGTTSSGTYTGTLTYTYAGTGIEGTTQTQPTNAGEYTLIVSVPDSDPSYIGTARYEFTIAKAKIAKPTVTNTNLVYTGSEQPAGIAANVAYTVTGDKGTNVNAYTATVALQDKVNYEWADGEDDDDDLLLDWAIAKATPAPATPINLTATVGQTLADIALPAGWEWHNPAASVGTDGTQKHFARHTPSDTENYHVLTDVELSVQVMNAVNPIIPQIATGSIRVQATGNVIMLENLPRNTKVQVYTLQGKQIYSTNSENSQILRIPAQTKGMYIVKVGSQTIRAVVR
jgi:hypothetical protein